MMRIFGTGILKSFGIALKNLFRPAMTVRYPDEKIELPERSRWQVVALYTEDGLPRCTACGICINACPSHVLHLDVETDPETREKTILRYNYQLGSCLMCGLCVEACPFDAIIMGKDYELATADPADLDQDLIVNAPAFRKRPA